MLAVFISATERLDSTAPKKHHSGGELLATLRPLRAQRRERSAALVLGSILVLASLVTCFQQSGSSR